MTLLRGFLQQQQQGGISQLLPSGGVNSPVKFSPSPGKFAPISPLRLSAVSMASAGTQTSPCRPLVSSVSLPVSALGPPAKALSLGGAGQATNLALSPAMKAAISGIAPATRPTAHSPSSSVGAAISIPLSPPIPSVSVIPSPGKTPLQTVPSPLFSTPSTLTTSSSSPPRPKKTGSLALFYRKVYMMAHLRIKDLCERLDQTLDFQQK